MMEPHEPWPSCMRRAAEHADKVAPIRPGDLLDKYGRREGAMRARWAVAYWTRYRELLAAVGHTVHGRRVEDCEQMIVYWTQQLLTEAT